MSNRLIPQEALKHINRVAELEAELKEAEELIKFALCAFDEEWTEARMRKAHLWLDRRKERQHFIRNALVRA